MQLGIIYKTTCLKNSKIYIGQTTHPECLDYFGSGKILLKFIKSFGKQNFKRETLKECKTQKELDFYEQYFIYKFQSNNPKIGYNILKGTANEFGSGVPQSIPNVKKRMINGIKKWWSNNPNERIKLSKRRKGTTTSEETKQKISKTRKKYIGQNHPLYGTRFKWITNGEQNKRLDINEDIPIGWKGGRT